MKNSNFQQTTPEHSLENSFSRSLLNLFESQDLSIKVQTDEL